MTAASSASWTGFSRALTIAIAVAFGIGLERSGFLEEILRYWPEIVYQSQQHIKLVLVSGGLAILIGVPFGVLLSRQAMRGFAEPIMQVLNVSTTIPTLAILAMAMTVMGIGERPAIFALWLHALLPIVRNSYEGVRALPPHMLEAARGMGMRPRQVLLRVELPNALPVILAGIRTALVINVGTVPLAFLIGGGGLGELILSGIDLFEPAMMLAGAIPTGILAVIVDFLLGRLTALVVPRGVTAMR
jgi:osmoprotectant transport system permease protein